MQGHAATGKEAADVVGCSIQNASAEAAAPISQACHGMARDSPSRQAIDGQQMATRATGAPVDDAVGALRDLVDALILVHVAAGMQHADGARVGGGGQRLGPIRAPMRGGGFQLLPLPLVEVRQLSFALLCLQHVGRMTVLPV